MLRKSLFIDLLKKSTTQTAKQKVENSSKEWKSFSSNLRGMQLFTSSIANLQLFKQKLMIKTD